MMRNKRKTAVGNAKKEALGFTLIELLVTVSLIIVAVGITGDIVLNLVRAYTRTQISNELEANGNYAMQKIEKELRRAYQINTVTNDTLTFSTRTQSGGTLQITYKAIALVDTNIIGLFRYEGTEPMTLNNDYLITDVEFVSLDPAVTVFQAITPLGSDTEVIKVTLSLKQATNNPAVALTDAVKIEKTIVLRGSY